MSKELLLGRRIPSADEAEQTLRLILPADGSVVDFTPWIAENLGLLHGFGRWPEVGRPGRETPLSVRWAYWRGRRLARLVRSTTPPVV